METKKERPPFCQCLYQIEKRIRRTKYCFKPCEAQLKILKERENNKNNVKKI